MRRCNVQLAFLALYDKFFVAKIGDVKPRSVSSCALLTLGIVTVFSVAFWSHLIRPFPILPDGHMVLSFELAVNRIAFGNNGIYTGGPNPPIRTLLATNPAGMTATRLIDLPALVDKSPENYRKFLQPVTNNENALSYQHEFLMRLFPQMTVAKFGIALNMMRFFCLTAFAFALLRLNFSVIVAGLSLAAGMVIIDLVNQTHAYSLYPNLIAFSLLLIGVASISLQVIFDLTRIRLIIPLAIVIGALGAVLWNFRSSYFPIVVCIFSLFMLYIAVELSTTARIGRANKWLLLSASGVALFVGACAVQGVFISPLPETGSNYKYHVIWHPVVLGLAMPGNEFANKQGIAWDDSVGEGLAKQIDPEATYLGPTYERALMSYYMRLWRVHPVEMMGLYINKFKVAGMGAIHPEHGYFPNQSVAGYNKLRTGGAQFVSILRVFPDGRFLFAALLAVCLIAMVGILFSKTRAISFLVSAVGFCGSLIFLEHVIILPINLITHFSFLLFWFVFALLIIYQLLFNAISAILHYVFENGRYKVVAGHDNSQTSGRTP